MGVNCEFNKVRFAIGLCKSLLSSVGSEKYQWLTTQCFDQYPLIVELSLLSCQPQVLYPFANIVLVLKKKITTQCSEHTERNIELSTTDSFQNQQNSKFTHGAATNLT